MPFLRFSRDRHGYENTVLLHADAAGARPRVLYWYRSAPGVRVGRAALDEEAIRTIEVQHPEIDFDWPHILEVGIPPPPEPERRPQRPRRKAKRAGGADAGWPGRDMAPQADSGAPEDVEPLPVPRREARPDTAPEALAGAAGYEDAAVEAEDEPRDVAAAPAAPPHDLLEQLVGREIATRLRARYAEVCARIDAQPFDEPTREAWRARATPLDPDGWVTPTEIVTGVERADRLFDALRRELLGS
ncbi:MAG: hypothetical protein AB7O67_21995 [Vicinamibacterales bacterium]